MNAEELELHVNAAFDMMEMLDWIGIDAKLREMMSNVYQLDPNIPAVWLRAVSSHRQNLQSWEPLLNAVRSACAAHGKDPTHVLYGMWPASYNQARTHNSRK